MKIGRIMLWNINDEEEKINPLRIHSRSLLLSFFLLFVAVGYIRSSGQRAAIFWFIQQYASIIVAFEKSTSL